RYYSKACELDYDGGCVIFLAREDGELANKQEVFQYLSKACDLKDGEGCFNLGSIYELNGYGVVKKDLKKAARYYSKACELDYDGGCVIFLAREDGELANKQEVFQYLSKAC
ncbi:tetratricopeptide repeat protein, partial [Helicobacter pylori]|uniref:tetratricopeptide repeat protein n=1 Tax=Helicobacter pylori TaxID=210 RepID=UPI000F114D46